MLLPPAGLSQPAERAVDLLGDLPTVVLDKVLAGLPARDLVRTSVLSPPWRRRWESVPGVDIELHGVRDDEGGAPAWWGSAARFLDRCAGPVGRVGIRGVPLSVCRRADDWVRAAAGKSPRSLSLALPLAAPLPSLFRCDPAALAELELRCCAIPAMPDGFAGFHKHQARSGRRGVHGWECVGAAGGHGLGGRTNARGAPPAERRFPRRRRWSRLPKRPRWVIQAPDLRRLDLCLWIVGAGFWELLGPRPNLEFARIFLNDTAEDRDYVQMFTAISNVRGLHIGNFDMNTQAGAINIFQDLLWRFENLKILKLDANFYVPPHHLFSLSRFLQTVEIKSWNRSGPQSMQSRGIHILTGCV